MRNKLLGKILLVIALLATQTFAKEATKQSVIEMMNITGANELGSQFMEQLVVNFKKMDEKVPEKYWDDLAKEVDMNEITQKMIPVYQKYFTQEDVDKAIEFYNTEAGKKLLKHQTTIYQDSVEAGRAWINDIGKMFYTKYKKDYMKK